MGNIYADGINQSDLYTMLDSLQDNFNDMCDELTTDTDGTFTTTTYDVTLNMNDKNVTSGTGLGQDVVYSFLKDWIDKFNALCTALDSTNLSDSNYATACAITDNFDDSTKSREIRGAGMYQGDLVYTLNGVLTNLALLTAKLDADGSSLCSGYATAYDITDTVDTTGA